MICSKISFPDYFLLRVTALLPFRFSCLIAFFLDDDADEEENDEEEEEDDEDEEEVDPKSRPGPSAGSPTSLRSASSHACQ